jgi:hypothetical protein
MQISALQSATAGVARTRQDVQAASDRVSSGGVDDLTAAALAVGDAVVAYTASALTVTAARTAQKSFFDALV